MDTDDRYSDHDDKTENNLKLIKEISLRSALFNYQLPSEQRTKKIRDGLWIECAEELQTTVYDCQRRWKNLRDTYHLYRQHHKNLLERWRYTESLSFLQNIHTVKTRKKKNKINENLLTNGRIKCDIDIDIEDEQYFVDRRSEADDINIKFENHNVENESMEKYYEEGNNNSSENEEKMEKTSRFKRRRTKKSGKRSEIHNNNDEATRDDSDPIMVRNESNGTVLNNQKDEIDLFLDFLNKKIRKLSLNDINEIQRKFLDIVLEKESKLSKH